METNDKKYRWIPLETNPEIFNEYFYGLGLSDKYYFQEIMSFDYKLIQDLDSNKVKGMLVTFIKEKENSQIYNEHNFIKCTNNFPPDLFYMLQTNELTNACGVVGGLHLIGNIDHKENMFNETNGSLLKEFFANKKQPNGYTKYIYENNQWKEFHSSIATKGGSIIPENEKDVKYHYVAYVVNNDKLYELDGRLNYPYVHNMECKKEELIDKVIELLKQRILNKDIKEYINMMCLSEK